MQKNKRLSKSRRTSKKLVKKLSKKTSKKSNKNNLQNKTSKKQVGGKARTCLPFKVSLDDVCSSLHTHKYALDVLIDIINQKRFDLVEFFEIDGTYNFYNKSAADEYQAKRNYLINQTLDNIDELAYRLKNDWNYIMTEERIKKIEKITSDINQGGYITDSYGIRTIVLNTLRRYINSYSQK